MSFYDTTNPVNFSINAPKRAIAPFGALNRLASATYVGTSSLTLTASQVVNGAIVVAPTAGQTFTLPAAFALQQFLGGAKVVGDHVNGTSNEYFLFKVYNLTTNATTVAAGTDGTGSKAITAASVADDAVYTPVLIQFTAVGEDGVAAYTVY
jgi:hypothetical protein